MFWPAVAAPALCAKLVLGAKPMVRPAARARMEIEVLKFDMIGLPFVLRGPTIRPADVSDGRVRIFSSGLFAKPRAELLEIHQGVEKELFSNSFGRLAEPGSRR